MQNELLESGSKTLRKLKEISEPAPSDWREHAKWRQENRYWTRYSGCIALYLLMHKGGTCGVHDYIKEKLSCDDSTVRKICKGDYDFKMSEVLKLVTPEELSNIISGGYKYFKDKEEKNGND
jgi:hypothetical protein